MGFSYNNIINALYSTSACNLDAYSHNRIDYTRTKLLYFFEDQLLDSELGPSKTLELEVELFRARWFRAGIVQSFQIRMLKSFFNRDTLLRIENQHL